MIGPAHGNLSGKRLVIFGCGYVGSELARQSVAQGLRVTALTRNAQKAEVLRGLGVETVEAELSGASWHAAIQGPVDLVVNCVSSGGGGVDGYRRSYLEGTASVLAWARAIGGVDTLVYTGSTSVYAQGGGVSVDELAPTGGAGERADILLETEALVRASSGEAGACRRAFVLRLAGIYGPGRHHLLEQIRAGEVAGKGDYHLNIIHRDDICAAIWSSLAAPATVPGGTFNVVDNGAARKVDIVTWLAGRLRLPVPKFTGEPASGRRQLTPDRIISNAKAKALLEWRPAFPTFRDGYENLLSR